MPAAPLPASLSELVAARLAALEAAAPAAAARLADPTQRARIGRLLLASDYAFEWLRRHPGDLAAMLDGSVLDGSVPDGRLRDDTRSDNADPDASCVAPVPGGADFAGALRRHRHAAGLTIALRDVDGSDTIDQTLAATSALADRCLSLALEDAERHVVARHGALRRGDGSAQRLVVFGLGKLGGSELNFSSDVDLVFGYPDPGASDGARPLDADAWCGRLGQRLIQTLAEPGVEGFVYRVDMRLRPFGNAGRLALSFGAMEQYFQREGRDWERYAWIKARPVAGDLAAGEACLRALRPFIYRRYLDYTAFEGLREMKGLIAAQVQRLDLAGHIKLGPGGIREIEFIAQLLQLIRGGREAALRTRGLLPALSALAALGHLGADAAARLAAAYRFLRRLENRLQLLREEQTHELPEDPLLRQRIALALGYPGWDALAETLAAHRAVVSEEFERVFDAPRRKPTELAGFDDYWTHIDSEDAVARLGAAGLPDGARLHAQVHAFAHSPALLALSARARGRLDRVLPALLAAAASSPAPVAAIERALRLLHAILRRSSYLALLAEQPAALTRVIEVMGASAQLADRIVQHPLLLDDLLDRRSELPPVTRTQVDAELARALAGIDDTEALLHALNEFRQSQSFRIGLAALSRSQPAPESARQLAWVAEAIITRLLPQAVRELARSHGRLPGADDAAGLAIVGYGSFGGCELGFGSDLDLVFLFDGALIGTRSDGERPLEAPQYYARLMQRLVNLLSTLTPAGRLYEADLRLRPDGAKGLLVSTLESYADYQRERAWTWEHQALVRARAIAGSARLVEAYRVARADVLARPRDADALRADVVRMRGKMRAELDRSTRMAFDLKQGEGGLVDLEFLLQALVLVHAARHPELVAATGTPALLDALGTGRLLADAAALAQAHALLLQRALECTLDARARLVPPDAAIERARASIRGACRAQGLVFGGDPAG